MTPERITWWAHEVRQAVDGPDDPRPRMDLRWHDRQTSCPVCGHTPWLWPCPGCDDGRATNRVDVLPSPSWRPDRNWSL